MLYTSLEFIIFFIIGFTSFFLPIYLSCKERFARIFGFCFVFVIMGSATIGAIHPHHSFSFIKDNLFILFISVAIIKPFSFLFFPLINIFIYALILPACGKIKTINKKKLIWSSLILGYSFIGYYFVFSFFRAISMGV